MGKKSNQSRGSGSAKSMSERQHRPELAAGLVHFICDYAPGDLAISEVMQALVKELPETWKEYPSSIESFNTIETGFVVGQLSLQSDELRPARMIVYANCAPRKDKDSERRHNEGEDILYGRLSNGVEILAVNSGYSLSFIREHLVDLRAVKAKNKGSQFRSRDFYPAIVGKIARQETLDEVLKKPLDPLKVIPNIPDGVIGYRDSFGNLKTTYRRSSKVLKGLKAGDRLDIEINGIRRAVTIAPGSFSIREGDIAFAPGSSGHGDRYWEVFQRSGNAWATFGKPRVGAPIILHR